MNKLKMLLLTLCAGTFFFLAGTVTVQAKTADQMTPSEETVCDEYSGALFGLCNAYCEAQDCGDPRQRSANRACAQIQKNFIKKAGVELVCETEPEPESCPCFTSVDITGAISACDFFEDGGAFEDPSDRSTFIEEINGDFFVVSNDFEDGRSCAGTSPVSALSDISEEQANLCRDEILAAAALVCD